MILVDSTLIYTGSRMIDLLFAFFSIHEHGLRFVNQRANLVEECLAGQPSLPGSMKCEIRK